MSLKRDFLPGREPLPSRDDLEKGASISVWMKEKGEADRKRVPGLTPELWCVRGGLYDLSGFARLHPGGSTWIEETRGMDVTEWFETHHVDIGKAEALLARYKVGDATRFDPILTFEPSGFYSSLRRRVYAELHRQRKGGIAGPARRTVRWGVALLLAWAGTFCAMARRRSGAARGSYLFAVPCGLLLYALSGLGHNFFHMRDTRWRYLWDLTFFSSYRWRLSHALAHHPFANLEIDPEASAVEPYVAYLRSRKPNHWSVYLRWLLLNVILGPVSLLTAVAEQLKGRGKLLPTDMVPLLQWAAAWKMCGSARRGAGLVCSMHAVWSFTLILLSTPVHRCDFCWTEGCDEPELDYGRHIVKTTQEYYVNAPLLGRIMLGFNDHIIHHLFPTVDLANQGLIRPLLEEEMRKHGVAHRPVPFLRLLIGTLTTMTRPESDTFYIPPGPPKGWAAAGYSPSEW
eukprot:TRINITY_DN55077_c0_g1_i1.p1 TRINITY_DN55077_c0_g1~~TRINITY_DN55077_c0_g1_i1.p1  ORF type:complete len:485 (+),score=117.57 TRINITY_DN55077_c0_g1_i1:82-1455(+)